ncbi:UNVERIFIED_CONTAM: hypothetical protein Slati_4115600 [Sesamum latifolium]|uniref:Uncharacterized protein n=1 Tax=Sesamum latifolium TaxID=2727402 RepID=A0AAW2T8P7_9LAMI
MYRSLLKNLHICQHKNLKWQKHNLPRARGRERGSPFLFHSYGKKNRECPRKTGNPQARPIKPAAPPVKLVVSVPLDGKKSLGPLSRPYYRLRQNPHLHPHRSRASSRSLLDGRKAWTPLPSLLQAPPESTFAPPPEQSIIVPPAATYSDDDYGNRSVIDDQGDNEEDGSSDSELDTHSFETDSFSSAKSLLANGPVSTTELSGAAPVQQTCDALKSTISGELQSPGSPASEAESTASSYATGTTSLVGASFLEWLFPLLVPSSSLPDKVGNMEKDPSHQAYVQGKEALRESNCSQVRRPLLTLEELIVMSRRRSCQRRIAKMHKQPSMVTISSSLSLDQIY